MKRVHEALVEGNTTNARVEEIMKGVDWAHWQGPGSGGLMHLLDAETETLVWVGFDENAIRDKVTLEGLLTEDKLAFEEQGEDPKILDNPLQLIITVKEDKGVGTTNEMRTLYIMFHLWCDAIGLTPEDHDCYKTIQEIPNERYYRLRGHAFFVILKSDKCPICWEHIGPERRRSLPVVCDCGKKFGVDVPNQKAWVEDD